MQEPLYCIDDAAGIYCVINPYNCYNKAQQINQQSCLKCKYCKAYQIITTTTTHQYYELKQQQSTLQCKICKSVNDVNKSKVPIIIKNNNNSYGNSNDNSNDGSNNIQQSYQYYNIFKTIMPKQQQNILQILIVYQLTLGQSYSNALLCLTQILPQLSSQQSSHNIGICCIFYDINNIHIVQLCNNGRIIRMNPATYQIINQQFYPISKQETLFSLSQSLTTVAASLIDRNMENSVSNKNSKNSKVNGSKVISDAMRILNKKTVVIWLGEMGQQSVYYQHQKRSYVEVIGFVKIPKSVTNMKLSEALLQMESNIDKIYFIATGSLDVTSFVHMNSNTNYSNSSNNKHTKYQQQQSLQQIHYQLYNIFMNSLIINLTVESSRQKKHPPQIITPRNIFLTNLHQNIIIKINSGVLPGQNIQITMNYLNQNAQKIRLCVNFNINKYLNISSLENIRYLKLYLTVRSYVQSNNKDNKRLQMIKTTIQRDVIMFISQCSLLQRLEIYQNRLRYQSIYLIWPWIGFINKIEPIFVYYFKGYYTILKQQKEYGDSLQKLNQYCHTYYANKSRIALLYYKNILEGINIQNQYADQKSDSDSSQNQDRQYYRFQFDGKEQDKQINAKQEINQDQDK